MRRTDAEDRCGGQMRRTDAADRCGGQMRRTDVFNRTDAEDRTYAFNREQYRLYQYCALRSTYVSTGQRQGGA
eukprot:239419-Rhodomonas_salina.3